MTSLATRLQTALASQLPRALFVLTLTATAALAGAGPTMAATPSEPAANPVRAQDAGAGDPLRTTQPAPTPQ